MAKFELREGENAFEEALAKVEGVSEVKGYTLCNNYGWTFKKNGQTFDVRFWANCYGVYIGTYQLHTPIGYPKVEGCTESRRVADLLPTIEAL